jgi:hypothetical protein
MSPGGYIAASEGLSTVAICPAGTYAGAGSSECTPCHLGYFSDAGSAICADACPAGPPRKLYSCAHACMSFMKAASHLHIRFCAFFCQVHTVGTATLAA